MRKSRSKKAGNLWVLEPGFFSVLISYQKKTSQYRKLKKNETRT
jgi:hypothetical protein